VVHPTFPRPPRRVRVEGLFSRDLLVPSLKQAFVMLRPDLQWSNPVMFVVEIGAFLTLLFVIQALFAGSSSQVPVTYFIALDAWLFLTVVFANFATAVAEARGRAQAESLRKTRRDT
jgi:K+-transporting ATPase ATPase B chain